MNVLKTAVEEIWGLFVEDGSLAAGILVWLAVAAFGFPLIHNLSAYRGPALFLGLAVLLYENVCRSAKKR